MRRAIVALLGTAAGTTLLVGMKAGIAQSPAATANPGVSPEAASPTPANPGPANPGPANLEAGSPGPVDAPGAATGTPGAAAGALPNPPTGSRPLKDGEFTGSLVTVKYGQIQVRITVGGGRMTDVTALRLPNGDPMSVKYSERAGPTLRQEALTAQSASFQTVSGATYTAFGYTKSLQAALDAAQQG